MNYASGESLLLLLMCSLGCHEEGNVADGKEQYVSQVSEDRN